MVQFSSPFDRKRSDTAGYLPRTDENQGFYQVPQVGIAEKGFEILDELWWTALSAIEECPCEAGCPSCIQSSKCGNNNEPLDKTAAAAILRELLKR